jgi:hypothetical protein
MGDHTLINISNVNQYLGQVSAMVNIGLNLTRQPDYPKAFIIFGLPLQANVRIVFSYKPQ